MSRDLDLEVLEKVFGYKRFAVKALSLPMVFGARVSQENAFPRQDSLLLAIDEKYPHYFHGHCNDMYQQDGCTLPDVPAYSEEIEAAWQVVEKLRSLGFSVSVNANPDSRRWLTADFKDQPAKDWVMRTTDKPFQAVVCRHEPDADCWIVVCDPIAKTPEEAICLAAIQAVREAKPCAPTAK